MKTAGWMRIVVDENDCWRWTGPHDKDGYGTLREKEKTIRVHRKSYEENVGPLSDSELVCHSCDIRDCLNPGHLWKGSNADNIKDMVSKGRNIYGERSCMAKLTSQMAIEILLWLEIGIAKKALARLYSVSPKTIRDLSQGKTWLRARTDLTKIFGVTPSLPTG